MSFIRDPLADLCGYGTEGETMIDPEKVMSAISKLTDIAEELKNIETKLNEISDPLEATWVGTARGAYVRAEYFVETTIQKNEETITKLHSEMIVTCFIRKRIDWKSLLGATTNLNL